MDRFDATRSTRFDDAVRCAPPVAVTVDENCRCELGCPFVAGPSGLCEPCRVYGHAHIVEDGVTVGVIEDGDA